MSKEKYPGSGEPDKFASSGEVIPILKHRPAVAVDRWQRLSDQVGTSKGELRRTAEIACSELSEELKALTLVDARRSAEIAAEIIRRGDTIFALYCEVERSILHLSVRDSELAAQLWEMFEEYLAEAVEEASISVREYLEYISKNVGRSRGNLRISARDLAAMVTFYFNHVDR
jgi:hypothetical protein